MWWINSNLEQDNLERCFACGVYSGSLILANLLTNYSYLFETVSVGVKSVCYSFG